MNKTLALFDLDHTLIPHDSDVCWTRFLIKQGKLKKNNSEINERFYDEYKNGTLNLSEFLEYQLQPLKKIKKHELLELREKFINEVIRPLIKPVGKDLVKSHLSKGDVCAIVTATNEFITEPIADLFNIPTLIATKLERDTDDNFTGRPTDIPSFQDGKVIRVNRWLEGIGINLSDFHKSYFYSDSINDLPLLKVVTHPIATNPDKKLRSYAKNSGWKIYDIF